MPRYYLGVDWADRVHQLYGGDENGIKVMEMKVQENPEGLAELAHWLNQSRAEQVELWAAIEKPHGRIVDFLLDHGVVVYPVNPKVLDRAWDRFRMSQSKSDPFDAWVLSDFLRTDHGHLRPLGQILSRPRSLSCLPGISKEWCVTKRVCSISSSSLSRSTILDRWRFLGIWRLV